MNFSYLKNAILAVRSGNRPASRLGKLLSRPGALFVAGIAVIGVHVLFADDMYPTLARFLAGLLAFASYFAVLQVVKRDDRNELPFRDFYTILFYVFFGLPVFWEDELPLVNGATYVPTGNALNLALLAAVIALAIFYLFFPLGRRLGMALQPHLTRLLPKGVPGRSSGLFVLLVLVPAVLLVTYSSSLGSYFLPESIRRIVLFSASAMLLLAVTLRLGVTSKSPRYKIAAMLMLLASSMIGLLSGMLESVLLPLAVVTTDRWLSSKRLPMLWVLMGLLLFLFLNPAKALYREAAWDYSGGKASTLTPVEQLDIWQHALESRWGLSDNTDNTFDSTRSRMADLLPVAQAIEYVPERVPYAEGEPWLAIPYSVIPRLLWPNKPDLTQISNGRYAIVFSRLTEEQAQITAFNLPQLADGYWNLGWLGVVIVGVLAGLAVGFKAGAFSTKTWTSCAIAIVFFVNLRPQGDISSLITGTIQTFVGAVVLLWVLKIGERVFQIGSPRPQVFVQSRLQFK